MNASLWRGAVSFILKEAVVCLHLKRPLLDPTFPPPPHFQCSPPFSVFPFRECGRPTTSKDFGRIIKTFNSQDSGLAIILRQHSLCLWMTSGEFRIGTVYLFWSSLISQKLSMPSILVSFLPGLGNWQALCYSGYSFSRSVLLGLGRGWEVKPQAPPVWGASGFYLLITLFNIYMNFLGKISASTGYSISIMLMHFLC